MGDGLASGSDPLADLVRVASSAVIRSRQMKSNGPAGLGLRHPLETAPSELGQHRFLPYGHPRVAVPQYGRDIIMEERS